MTFLGYNPVYKKKKAFIILTLFFNLHLFDQITNKTKKKITKKLRIKIILNQTLLNLHFYIISCIFILGNKNRRN